MLRMVITDNMFRVHPVIVAPLFRLETMLVLPAYLHHMSPEILTIWL